MFKQPLKYLLYVIFTNYFCIFFVSKILSDLNYKNFDVLSLTFVLFTFLECQQSIFSPNISESLLEMLK